MSSESAKLLEELKSAKTKEQVDAAWERHLKAACKAAQAAGGPPVVECCGHVKLGGACAKCGK